MKKNRIPVDIIVPIYNAYEDLMKCVDSVKTYTDLKYDRLILINDCSTDERIADYLKLLEKNIVVINNEKNMGFSNNVNLGMQCSDDRDVLLLNSDTIVTANWLDKIVNCAYSRDEIGTVTPLSNSATLCSFPNMLQDNELPEGVSLDDLAEVVEQCSLKAYPRITVAVGFCMFIKRKTIKDVGYFDAETFEHGYGEENDFCNRAEQLGYIHVMCDDTFIYHKGTASFETDQKQQLKEEHDRILHERYPDQMEKNTQYCITNPDQYIRDNIMPYLHVKNGKENLLYLSHLDFISGAEMSVGGTQSHVRDLTMGLKNKYNIFVMSRDREYLRLTIYTEKATDYFMFYVGAPELFFNFTDAHMKKIFDSVLDGFKIKKVHIHHTYRISFDLFYLAKEKNIPIITSLHDYYYICPSIKLYNSESGYCGGKCGNGKAKKCLFDNKKISNKVNYLEKWRCECRKVLALSDRIIAPSEAAKKIYVGVYPELKNKIDVIEHATEIKSIIQPTIENVQRCLNVEYFFDKTENCATNILRVSGWAVLKNVDNHDVNIYVKACTDKGELEIVKCKKCVREDIANYFHSEKYLHSGFECKIFLKGKLKASIVKLSIVFEKDGIFFSDMSNKKVTMNNANVSNGLKHKIAFMGVMIEEKGAKTAFETIKNDEKYEWYIIGDILYEPLAMLEKKDFFKLGGYSRDELPKIIQTLGIELIFVLPVWPETFCYTISEAILCDVPVLGTDIGAVGDRIKKHGYGWTISVDAEYKELLRKTDDIFNNAEEYDNVMDKVKRFKEIKLEKMVDQYDEVYTQLEKDITYNKVDNGYIFEAMLKANQIMYRKNLINVNVKEQEYKEEIERLSQRLNLIEKSRSYKLLRKVLKLMGRSK